MMAINISGIDIKGIMDKIWNLFIEVISYPFILWNKLPPEFHNTLFVFLFIVSLVVFIYTVVFIRRNPDILY
jgi:hypothetical protein